MSNELEKSVIKRKMAVRVSLAMNIHEFLSDVWLLKFSSKFYISISVNSMMSKSSSLLFSALKNLDTLAIWHEK